MAKKHRGSSADPQKKLKPNFPPKLQLTYKDEDGKMVRILPTNLNPEGFIEPEYIPLWRPEPY